MITIKNLEKELYLINKSKFYSFAYPVFEEGEVKRILDDIRGEYKDATHVCFAYILSAPRVEKASDDGEPTGTAGKPMLELLKKKKLENILLVIVRYFGGIKLGAGGLVRAYTNSGNLVLDKCQTIRVELVNKYLLKCDLSMGSKVSHTISSLGGKIINAKYLDMAYFEYIGEIENQIKSMYNDIIVEKIGSETLCQ